MKKIFQKRLFRLAIGATMLITALTAQPLFAQEDKSEPDTSQTPIPISIFEREDCVHCQDEKAFLEELTSRRADIEIHHYDIALKSNYDLWYEFAEMEGIPKVTPITLVGNTVIQGFDTAETTGAKIESLVEASTGEKTYTIEEYIAQGGGGKVEKVSNGTCDSDGLEPCEIDNQEELVNIPFFGPTNIKKYSIPAMSAILGFIDGFNPCAMWVLITFIVILIDAGSRKKMWQLAGIFIVAEAAMYYLILNVWFTTWDFIGLNSIITPIVGIIAVAAGTYFLYEWKTSDGTCKVGSVSHKAKTRNKIKALVQAEMTLLTLLGILGVAFSVNIIEFACSVGIPQTFTKIIELNNLSFWETQFHMAIYILMYMVDDLIVFGIALYSFEKIGVTTKYTKISHLIGGALMIVLGLILLLKPELLILS